MFTTHADLPPAEIALLERTARSMTVAGATLSGSQRRALASLCRAFAAEGATGEGRSFDESLAEVVHRMTRAPASIRPSWIRELERSGVVPATYVEVLGLVGRLTAIDTFCFALGLDAVSLPPPAMRDVPTGRIAPEARIDRCWVPTVGPESPHNALSMVPDEHDAMHDLHGVFYLTMAGLADLDADRGLHRTQMELVAGRTSFLNECFF